MDETITQKFSSLYFDKNGVVCTKRIPSKKTKYTDPDLWEKDFKILQETLQNMTNFDFKKLDKKLVLRYGLFIIQNNLSYSDLMCELNGCSFLKRFNINHNVLQKFCSHKCYSQHNPSKEKRKETCVTKYGVSSYTQTQSFKNKYRNTMKSKYGVDHNFQMLTQGLTPEEIQKKFNTRGNLQNQKLYFNKGFISDNFFDKDHHFKLRSFMAFFGVSQMASHFQIKRLGLRWNKYSSFSSGEIWVKEFLESKNIQYMTEYIFEDCVNPITNSSLRFDFYLPELNICIEFDGEQHTKPILHFGGNEVFKQRQLLDLIKDQYCSMNDIKMIRIDHKFTIKELL